MTGTAPPSPPSLQERLDALRRASPPTTLRNGGATWTYTATGRGPAGLLCLPGAAGGGEAYLPLVERLAGHCRLILVSYPPVTGLAPLVQGLHAICGAEGLARVSLLGGSFGGLVAQAYLRRFPASTDKVVLSATAPPDPRRAVANERWLRLLRFLPIGLPRAVLRLAVSRLLRRVAVERDFWRRFYFDAVAHLERADLASRYRVSIDFDRQGALLPGDLDPWPGEMLVLEGSADSLTPSPLRETLATSYPRAQVVTLEGAGHGIALERPDEWAEAVGGFLLGRPGLGAERAGA